MRDVKQLKPELQAIIKDFLKKAEKKGYKVGIGECLRSADEQNKLYAQGRTVKGNKVTNAKGDTFSSQHQWGIAFDIYRNDGKGAYDDNGDWFKNVAKIAKSCGLAWGGDWTSIVDKPHFYLPEWGSDTSKLKKLYGTPKEFMKKWNK